MTATKTTITEALQEIKTIGNRLGKKRASLAPYIARDRRVIDPMGNTPGGSEAFIKSERQAIHDLEERIVSIRTAIQVSNLSSPLTVGGVTRKVAEWLNWRKEIAPESKAFVTSLSHNINSFRNEVQKKGGKTVFANAVQVNEGTSPNDPPQMVINIDEKALLAEQDLMETILGELDGKLSLFNATTTIEV